MNAFRQNAIEKMSVTMEEANDLFMAFLESDYKDREYFHNVTDFKLQITLERDYYS